MQEKLKKVAHDKAEPTPRSVTFCLKSRSARLFGIWKWNMHCDAVYCSDVMSFPGDFEGTKAIIYPDDLPKVTGALELLKSGEIFRIDFRIITTYGELKKISGSHISAETDPDKSIELLPGKEQWQEILKQLSLQKEADLLQLRKEITDLTEKHTGIGAWLINKETTEAWYSDNVFRIYGLAPQSLNANANTFYRFVHPEDRSTVLEAFEKAYTEDLPLHLEYRIVQADGASRYIKVVTDWIFNAKGQRIFAGIVKDASEEKALADELLTTQAHTSLHHQVLRFSEQQSASGYFYINLITRKSVYSDNYYRIYGVKQNALPDYNSFLNLVHPEDKERVRCIIDRMYAERVLPETEFRIIRPDGKISYLKQSGRLFEKPGMDLTMIGVVQDITVQKGLEKKIQEQADVWHVHDVISEMVETHAGVSSIVWFPDGAMQWSDGFFKWLGYKPGAVEPSSRLLHKHIHPDDLPIFKEAELLILNHQQQEPLEIRLFSRAGTRTTKITFYTTGHNKDTSIGLLQDIGQSLSLQHQLFQNKILNELVARSVHDILILTNTDHIVALWNDKAEEKTGISKEDALHHHLFDVLPNLNEEDFIGHLNAGLKGIEIRNHQHVCNRYLDGWHKYQLWPLKDEEQKVIGLLHVVEDVSKELELQKQLGERLNFIGSLVESSVDRIIVLDRFMNFLYWNRKAEECYAIQKQRVLGKNILEVFPSFRNHPGYNEFRKVLRGDTVYLPPADTDSEDYSETWLTPIKDETGDVTAVLWTIHDLSERRDAEKMLQEEHQRLKEAQIQIREQAHYLQRIQQTVPDMISVTNLLTREFEYLNKETFAAEGFDPADMNAMSPEQRMEMIHPDDRQILAAYFQKFETANDDEIITAEYRAKDNLGQWKWFLVRGRAFQRDESGIVTHILNVIENITERKNTEQRISQNKEFLQSVMDSSMDVIQVFNAVRNDEGKIVDFTWRGNNAKGIEQNGDVIGKSLLQQNQGVVASGIFDQMVQVVETNVPYHKAQYYSHEQFNDQWFDLAIVKYEDGVILTTRDFTSQKKELEEQQNMLIQTAIASPDAISIYDLEEKHPVYLNDRLSQWTGFTSEELIRLGFEGRLKLIHAADRKKLLAFNEAMQLAKDDEIKTIEYRLQTKKRMFWIRNRSKIFKRNAEGRPTHLLSVLQDFTEEMRLREQLNERTHYAEAIIDSSIDRMFVFDKEFRVTAWNKRSEVITGISKDKIIGKKLFDLFPKLQNDPVIYNAMDQARKGQYTYVAAKKAIYANIFYERFYIPLQNEEDATYGVLVIMHDVTDMVMKEAELKELNRTLEHKNSELEQKNEEITHFSFVASHDLQEPLRKIHTFSNWILEQEAERLSPMAKNFTTKIKAAVRRMESLIDDILVLTKIHSDQHRDESVDLANVLASVIEDMGNGIRYAGAEIEADVLPTIAANSNQVFYLFRNILSNAIKFQRPGNVPQVKITAEIVQGKMLAVPDAEKEYVKISFTDNGIGIDKKHQKRIFLVFQRLHAKNEYEGTGIGLAICKKIMENHGGQIVVESEKGKGSSFHCYFPLG